MLRSNSKAPCLCFTVWWGTAEEVGQLLPTQAKTCVFRMRRFTVKQVSNTYLLKGQPCVLQKALSKKKKKKETKVC